MEATYVDLHIHTSENPDNLNKKYDVKELVKKVKEKAKDRQALISLTDHNTINKDAYTNLIKETKSEKIEILLGVEIHIINSKNKPAYHCHIYFDTKNDLLKNIDEINAILDELYPKKSFSKKDKSIPNIGRILDAFEKYDFILIPHGGQNHATFEKSIDDKESTCDGTIERTIYYNQIEGFSARTNIGIEKTKKYLEKLGISSFVNLITGSDNYNPTKYPEPKANETTDYTPTWMYASPSFSGLRLALSEDSRLEYSQEPTTENYKIIKGVKLNNENIDIDVKLTQGLNVVIGESSSGKTLFVDSIVKKIKKDKKSEYEDEFSVSKLKLEDEAEVEPYYIPQNFITGAVKDNSELNKIDILKDLFPESEYKQDVIDNKLNDVKKIINDLINSVKNSELAEEKIKKVPLPYNLITIGEVKENIIDLFMPSKNIKDKIEYLQINANEDIKQINTIKEKITKNPLFNGNEKIFDNVIKEITELRNKCRVENDIREVIDKNKKTYKKIITDCNRNNNSIMTNRENLLYGIAEYIKNNNIFYESMKKLSEINIEVETIKRQYDNNTLYIKNDLQITESVLKEIIEKYYKNTGKKKLSNLTPKDLFKCNIYAKYKKDYDEIERKINDDIVERNKKIYKIIINNDKDFDKLSPGWKTAVILDIMLKFDQDNAPLIIDQPEDNLANTYINHDLIEGIKKAKKNKQIIMVSHNATIPMLGDAQNVILCMNKNNKLVLRSAGLEEEIDGKPVIEYIAEITDGGKKSIKKRFKKYNFKNYRED